MSWLLILALELIATGSSSASVSITLSGNVISAVAIGAPSQGCVEVRRTEHEGMVYEDVTAC